MTSFIINVIILIITIMFVSNITVDTHLHPMFSLYG
jgi:hypothetical protein